MNRSPGAIDRAPELLRYQDQPRQLPAAAPGKVGRLRLGFERRGDRTVLADLYRQAPLLVQQALYWDEAMPDLPCVFVCSTSGGVLQGDRLEVAIALGRDARAHVTTQGATRLQEMDANFASQTQEINLGPGAYLEYLPEALIPYRHSRFVSRTRVRVDAAATMLYAEIVMPGRKHHRGGELFEYDLLSLALRAERPDGRALFDERLLIEPQRVDVRRAGIMGPFDVFANVILLAPRAVSEAVYSATAATVDLEAGWAAGATRLPDDSGLAFRVLGMETHVVRTKVREFWARVRREAVGCALPPEFPWR